METKEFEALLETVLEAVDEKFVRPLALALHAVSLTACPDQKSREKLAEVLKAQASTCPEDIDGCIYLKWLAEQLVSPSSTGPSDSQTSLRSSLRLLQGKNRKKDA